LSGTATPAGAAAPRDGISDRSWSITAGREPNGSQPHPCRLCEELERHVHTAQQPDSPKLLLGLTEAGECNRTQQREEKLLQAEMLLEKHRNQCLEVKSRAGIFSGVASSSIIRNHMTDPLRELVQKALQSDSPDTAVEALIRDHPDLPTPSASPGPTAPPLMRFHLPRPASWWNSVLR